MPNKEVMEERNYQVLFEGMKAFNLKASEIKYESGSGIVSLLNSNGKTIAVFSTQKLRGVFLAEKLVGKKKSPR